METVFSGDGGSHVGSSSSDGEWIDNIIKLYFLIF